MSKLRAPVRNLLVDEMLDERELDRRAAAVAERLSRRRRRRIVAGAAIPIALAASILLVCIGRHPIVAPLSTRTDAGPLTLAGPLLGNRLDLVSQDDVRTFEFTDGSRIVLAPTTALEVMDNDGQRFDVALRHGRATFDVRPGGPRRWIVEGGIATVEVAGTRFTVDRDAARVRVDVERGAVLVRGDAVPNYVQRLTPGQHLIVGEPHLPVVVPAPRMPMSPAPAPKPREGRLVQSTDEHSHVMNPPPTIDDAVALADAARASGDLPRAVALLDAVAHQYPHDMRAALAAFTEARIVADDLHDPRTAAAAFSYALRIGLPAPLEEDARARLVEVFAAVHEVAAAREAAAEYARRYPNGRFRALVKRWGGQ